jgi:hypothetical protein
VNTVANAERIHLQPGSGPLRNPFVSVYGDDGFLAGTSFMRWLHGQPDLMRYIHDCLDGHCVPGQQEQPLIEDFKQSGWPRSGDRFVFVFGSNLAGRHGAGAARYAATHHGAQAGVGQGPTGTAWAVPTKDQKLKPLPLERVLKELSLFFESAEQSPDTEFRLSRVGCGLAGLDEKAIRQHCLDHAPENVILPGTWAQVRNPAIKRVIVTGSRYFCDTFRAYKALNATVSKIGPFEIVSAGHNGAEEIGEFYAVDHRLPFRRFPVRWDLAGRDALTMCEEMMVWYSTHLLVFSSLKDRDHSSSIVAAARRAGLKIHISK